MPAESFMVAIPEAALADLRRRLRATNWPDDFANEDWRYGTNAVYLRGLVDYWLNTYDWRAEERRINAFAHYRTTIEGMPIHFIHQRGNGPKPIPLIVTHGWPWCFWDMHKVIGPLADPGAHGGDPVDAFDVVVPSLPGFAFSTPLRVPGMNWWRTADVWHALMTEELGYERFAASGGDWGALVTSQLGHKYAPSLYGVHLMHAIPLSLFNSERPWDITGGAPLPATIQGELRQVMLMRQRRTASHVAVQVLDPQTLSYGMHDSPVGLLAWLVERRRAWGDTHGEVESRFPKDHLLTTTMLYRLTNSFVTSTRYYAEAAHNPWRPSHDRMPVVEAPTGFTFLGGESQPGVADPAAAFLAGPRAGVYNVQFAKSHPSGGHFGHYEEPEATVEDIRAMFRPLR